MLMGEKVAYFSIRIHTRDEPAAVEWVRAKNFGLNWKEIDWMNVSYSEKNISINGNFA